MSIPARVGVVIIAGLLVCGAAPAAHAVSQHSEEAQDSSTSMPCTVSSNNDAVIIAFPAEIAFDELTVSVDGQLVTPRTVGEASVTISGLGSEGTAHVELWDDASLSSECSESIPPPSQTAPPETEEPSTSTPTPSPSGSVSPKPSHPPTPTQKPPTSPEPTPTPSKSSSSSSAPSSDSSSPTQGAISPRPHTAPPSRVQPQETTRSTAQGPRTSSHRASEPLGPRIIRRFSDDPRYLLSRLLGINSQTDSELIMPHPRSAEQGPPDLETLPPVSEDELKALKARLTSPDRADHHSAEQAGAANVDEQAADNKPKWLLPGLLAAVCLGVGGFWLWNRRRQQH